MQSLLTHSHWLPRLTLTAVLFAGAGFTPSLVLAEANPAEIGEQFFLETRFAQFFKQFLTSNGNNVNELPDPGDPAVAKALNWKLEGSNVEPEDNEFTSMNCRSCHFVDEYVDVTSYGMRTYTDFARRSPIPAREDGKTTTARNSPPLVNASLPREIGLLLHFDTEFKSMPDLVEGTLTGRNYGFLPGEKTGAIAHIAQILKQDDGSQLDPEIVGGFTYRELLTGNVTDEAFLLPHDFLVPEKYFDEPSAKHNKRLFQAAAKLIAAYTEDLAFEKISPYDVFLEMNNLPSEPRPRQTDLEYSRELLKKIEKLEKYAQLQFVTEGEFQFHDQAFRFGEEELEGLKIFFAEEKPSSKDHYPKFFPSKFFGHKHAKQHSSTYADNGGVGNCIACHTAPNFTDFKFHNVGIAQAEYDNIHGSGAFANLYIPGLHKRNHHHNRFLPATEKHPNAEEPFRSIPDLANPKLTDLGVWNIFANPDFPKPQQRIKRILCDGQSTSYSHSRHSSRSCKSKDLLPDAIAVFKTPGLRDLGHSAPYFHTGQTDTLEGVIQSYINNSDLVRTNQLRNGDGRLRNITLEESDIAPLVAFLKSLNEDYE